MTRSNSPTKVSSADEATPLLVASAAGLTTARGADETAINTPRSADTDNHEDVPLPKIQILLLCYARLVEPLAFFCIFPFINQMIFDTGGIKAADVGFYTGVIESLFSLTQMSLMILWGRASDRFGRKPVLVFSLAGSSICTALFGMSKTIWQMVFFRCAAGAFAGTIVTVRVMFSENSTAKTQARAFSFFAFTGNMGILIGPLIGGALSNPTIQYGSLFGNNQFLKDYPYALPTIVCGSFGLVASIVNGLFLKETLNREADKSSSSHELMSTWEILKFPGVSQVLYIYGHVMLLAFAYTATIPIFFFTPVKLGGFGFTPLQISLFMGGIGFSQAIWTLVIFPPLQHRFGTGGVLRACTIAWPILFGLAPLANTFLRLQWLAAFWAVAPAGFFLGAGVCMAFTCVQLALNDISPSATTLGTLNALALTVSSGLRAVTPALFASIFATGARTQVIFGYLAWLIMVILAIGLAIGVQWLPAKAEGKLKTISVDEET